MSSQKIQLRAHHAGLFSLVNNILTCLSLFAKVNVQWASPECLYGTPADGNIFERLFEPLDPLDGDTWEVVRNYPDDQRLTYRNAAKLYTAEGTEREGWREYYQRHWLRLRPRIEIQGRVNSFFHNHFGPEMIGVLVRSHNHAGEQPTERSQQLHEYAAAIAREMTTRSKIFLMCGDQQTLAWFQTIYGDRLIAHPDTQRALSRDTDRHLAEPQTVEDAKQVLVETILLSRCQKIIHPVSNMATAALIMNPNAQSVYLP